MGGRRGRVYRDQTCVILQSRPAGIPWQEGAAKFYTYRPETMSATRAPEFLCRKETLVREILERVADKWTLLVIDALEGLTRS